MAEAGLNRLGIKRKDTFSLSIDACLPAPGQGALGIEMLDNNPKKSLLDPLYDEKSYICIETERMVSAGLGADCSLPVAALADLANGVLSLSAFVSDAIGERVIRVNESNTDQDQVVKLVLDRLYEMGAQNILDSFDKES